MFVENPRLLYNENHEESVKASSRIQEGVLKCFLYLLFLVLTVLREHLWYLDYPRQISIESFRNPNFPLVAEMLGWFTTR